MNNCIGLDISKRLIAVHIPCNPAGTRTINNTDIEIPNNVTGMRKLISKLKSYIKKSMKIWFLYMNQLEVIQIF